MSVESRDEVVQDPNYAVRCRSRKYDPLRLWQAILNVCKADCIINLGQVQELKVRKGYQNIRTSTEVGRRHSSVIYDGRTIGRKKTQQQKLKQTSENNKGTPESEMSAETQGLVQH
jgi:hypothetical protein